MPRPRSAHVSEVKAALVARLQGGFAQPGGRFLSTRAVAQRFTVSYQTAHRLLGELEAEGLLQRRAASGSYHPGQSVALRGVQLIFHLRAKRKGSFGAHLLELIEHTLDENGVPFVRTWADANVAPRLRTEYYPVAWECRAAVEAAAVAKKFALCLNDRPPMGIGGAYVDAVTTDDFSGGACAAELLKERTHHRKGFAVLGGPVDDPRSLQRIAGFHAHAPNAHVINAATWFIEGGRACAREILGKNPAGIFACNDRLAEALIEHCRIHGAPLPPLVGFDNAPVAERLRLTTVGIPWNAMVAQAANVITARLQGGHEPARFISLAHEPILRLTC